MFKRLLFAFVVHRLHLWAHSFIVDYFAFLIVILLQ
jgi:hypothetical protein